MGLLGRLLIAAAVLLIGGIVIGVMGVCDLMKINKGVMNFNSAASTADFTEGKFVDGYVHCIAGAYAEETTEYTNHGVKTSESKSGQYYIMPIYYINGVDDEDYSVIFVSIKTGHADTIKKLDKICEETWQWWEDGVVPEKPTELYLMGKVKVLKQDVKGFLDDYTADWELSSNEKMTNYVIEYYNPNTYKISITVGCVSLIIIVAGIVIFVRKRNKPAEDACFPTDNTYYPNDNTYNQNDNTYNPSDSVYHQNEEYRNYREY